MGAHRAGVWLRTRVTTLIMRQDQAPAGTQSRLEEPRAYESKRLLGARIPSLCQARRKVRSDAMLWPPDAAGRARGCPCRPSPPATVQGQRALTSRSAL
jgi:hypothetical protein